jgi:shikimate dehydrogenase
VNPKEDALLTFGLVGQDVANSLSPRIHALAMESAGVRGTYLAFPTRRDALRETVTKLKRSGASGFNVTIPFKQAIIELLDDLSPEARDIGAVNTVKIEGERMPGYNTDGEGFLQALADAGENAAGKKVLILGSGGAARAVCHALLRTGASALTIASRNAASAMGIARDRIFLSFAIPLRAAPLSGEHLDGLARDADIIVNATPLGSERYASVSPLGTGSPLRAGQFVMDLVYAPVHTTLLVQAEQAGARVMNGTRMLVHQALASLRIWLGVNVDAEYVFERL